MAAAKRLMRPAKRLVVVDHETVMVVNITAC
jgi:hypothetical protein